MDTVQGRLKEMMKCMSPKQSEINSEFKSRNAYMSPKASQNDNFLSPLKVKNMSNFGSPTKEDAFYLNTVSSTGGNSYYNNTTQGFDYGDIQNKLNTLKLNKSPIRNDCLPSMNTQEDFTQSIQTDFNNKKKNGRTFSFQTQSENNKTKFKSKIHKEIYYLSNYLASESKPLRANKPMISIEKPELDSKVTNYFSPVNVHRNVLVNRDIFKIYNTNPTTGSNTVKHSRAISNPFQQCSQNHITQKQNNLFYSKKGSEKKEDEVEHFFKDFKKKEKESILSKYGKHSSKLVN